MQACGSPTGTATPSASRRRPASSAAHTALLTRDDAEEGAPLGDELVDPLLHGCTVDGSQPELVERQRAEQPELVVGLVGVTSGATVDQALELELEIRQHIGVDELAQLLGTEEVAEEVAVERQSRRPALGEGGVSRVHVHRDPPEHERLRERRRLRAVDRDEPDLPRAQVAQHLDERGHVEHVVEALPGGLEEDREARVPTGDGEQVGRPLALLPQRRALVGAPLREEQGPRRRTRGTATRTSPCPAAARRSAPRSRRGR